MIKISTLSITPVQLPNMTTDKVYVYYNENVYRLTHEKLAHITLLLHVAVAKR